MIDEMSESEFADFIGGAVEAQADEEGHLVRVDSFERMGMLTMNSGIIISGVHGSEFHVTVMRNRR